MFKLNKYLYSIILLILLSINIDAQSSSQTTRRIWSGSSNPSICRSNGQNVFFNSSTGVLLICTSTNTWTTVGPVSSALTIGTTAITSGTGGRVLYETSGNKVGEISGATSDGTTLTLIAPVLGIPASGTLTNTTGLPAAGVVGTAAILGANTFTRGQTITQGTANESLIASTGYSITGSNTTAFLDLAGTWNTSGHVRGIKLAITNTASTAFSSPLEILVDTIPVLRHQFRSPVSGSAGQFLQVASTMGPAALSLHDNAAHGFTIEYDLATTLTIGNGASGLIKLGANTETVTVIGLLNVPTVANGANSIKLNTSSITITSGFGTGDAIAGNAMAFRLTVGTVPGTAATLTFGTAWATAPVCLAANETTANLLRPTASTTTVILNGVVVAGDKIVVHCIGY